MNSEGTEAKKIAIAHSHFLEQGGAERVVADQYTQLTLSGFLTDVFAMWSLKRDSTLPFEVREYLRLPSLPGFNLLYRAVLTILLRRIAARPLRNYDLVVAHHEPSAIIANQLKKRWGIPYISYLHSAPGFLHRRRPEIRPEREFGLGTAWEGRAIARIGSSVPLLRQLELRAIVESDAVLCNSRSTAKSVRELYGVEPILCYPGVDTAKFSPNNGDSHESEGEDDDRSARLLWVGRVNARKRPLFALKVLSAIRRQRPDVQLVIAGQETPYSEKLRSAVKSMGLSRNVTFTGWVSDGQLIKLYQDADVVLFTPDEEDFGLVAVEAMSCGTPVVAWGDKGPSETVINDFSGFQARPYEISDFAEKTLAVIDKEIKLKNGGRIHEYVNANFSLERHMKTMLASFPNGTV